MFFGRDENRPRDTWGSCERLRKDGMCPGVIIVRRWSTRHVFRREGNDDGSTWSYTSRWDQWRFDGVLSFSVTCLFILTMSNERWKVNLPSCLVRMTDTCHKLNKDLSIENEVNENKASLTRSTFFMISCFDQWMTWHEIDERWCVQMLIKRIIDDRPWNPRNPNSMLRKKKGHHSNASCLKALVLLLGPFLVFGARRALEQERGCESF